MERDMNGRRRRMTCDPVDHMRQFLARALRLRTIDAGNGESGDRRSGDLCVHAMSVHSYTLWSMDSHRQTMGFILKEDSEEANESRRSRGHHRNRRYRFFGFVGIIGYHRHRLSKYFLCACVDPVLHQT